MSNLALFDELIPIEVHLSTLFLDPNNPRFAEFESELVEDNFIEAAQERVQQLLVQLYQVEKLRLSMEVNGYLPIDRVVVREFHKEKYVLLEGNRRIAAAKSLLDMYNAGIPISDEVLRSLQTIPCLLYTGVQNDASWVFQGLRHISGVHEWSSFNKARLLVDQMETGGLSLTEVGKRFGLTPHGAGQWVRGYSAFKQAREKSDYINEVREEAFPYFLELFGPSSIAVREWMKWDEKVRLFEDELNFNEFVGWLYPRVTEDKKGDWESRRIARRDDIRQIAYLLRSEPEAFMQFRDGMELEKAYPLAQARRYEEESRKNADPTAQAFTAIQVCTKALENIPYRAMQDNLTKARLLDELKPLSEVISSLTLQ